MDIESSRPRTVSDLAQAIASKRPGAVEATVARAIRDVIQRKGLVPSSYAGSGRTAAALFDEPAACRALIAMELNRIGLSSDALIGARKCMNNVWGSEGDQYGPKEGSDAFRKDQLAAIIVHLRDGTPWYFHLYLVPEHFGVPGNVMGGTFSRFKDGAVPHDFATTVTLQLLPILSPLGNYPEVGRMRMEPI